MDGEVGASRRQAEDRASPGRCKRRSLAANGCARALEASGKTWLGTGDAHPAARAPPRGKPPRHLAAAYGKRHLRAQAPESAHGPRDAGRDGLRPSLPQSAFLGKPHAYLMGYAFWSSMDFLPTVARSTNRVATTNAIPRSRQMTAFWTKPATTKHTKEMPATVSA